MLISVIIPTYKPGDYIVDCLKSLANQTLFSGCFEIIIVLNGCKEPYEKFINESVQNILQGFSVTLLQTDTAGVSYARNNGLDVAKGEYICFIDDDDIVSNNYLEALLNKSNKETLVISDVKNFVTSISQSFNDYISDAFLKFKSKDKDSIFLKRSFLSTVWCKIIPKNLIGEKRFDVRFKIGEDALFMFAISQGIKRIVLSDDAIYYRRIRENSAVTKKRSLTEKIGNAFKLMMEETKIYFGGFPRYRFSFYITRLLGAVRGVLVG